MAEEFVRGGSWLVAPTDPKDVFTVEDFTEEHTMMAQTTEDFITGEVLPKAVQLVLPPDCPLIGAV